MAGDSSSAELKDLVEEYMIALELGQNGRVSSLGLKICVNLVDLFDEQFHDKQIEAKGGGHEGVGGEEAELSSVFSVICILCQKLREFSLLASAYDNVIEFVRIRDLACLSNLVNATSTTATSGDKRSARGVDFDYLIRILRQSVYLLKAINPSSATNRTIPSTWLNKLGLNREIGIGFPVYTIELDEAFSKRPDDELQPAMISDNQLPRFLHAMLPTNDDQSLLVSALRADWFKLFVDRTLAKPYPFDRFTILIAIWIVAVECRHWLLEQLIGELVDQIVHEETNSCNEEELMQLTQVGSFWLSLHKRHQTNIKQTDLLTQQAAAAEGGDQDDDDDDDRLSADEELGSQASLSSTESDQFEGHRGRSGDKRQDQHFMSSHQSSGALASDLMRLKMKRIINDELLQGAQCLVCNYKPRELLEPLNAGLYSSCPNCKQAPIERCWISFRPLELTSLADVLNCGQAAQSSAARGRGLIKKLVIVSPNEWARQMLIASSSTLAPGSMSWLPASLKSKSTSSSSYSQNDRLDEDSTATTIGERVDISENFERLTVIRRPRVASRAGSGDQSASGAEQSDDESTTTARTSSSDDENDDDSEAGQSERAANYSNLLERYMRARLSSRWQQTSGNRADGQHQPSESLRMIKHLQSSQQQQAEYTSNVELPLCSSDLIQLESSMQLVKVCLATSSELNSYGSIWACSARSQVSQLKLGCGRLFSSLELIRLSGKCEPSNEFVCPYCDNQLSEITSLEL